MDDEKKLRIFKAFISATTVLLVVLFMVMIYQLISINVRRKQLKELNETIDQLQEDINGAEDEVEEWLSRWKIEREARKRGYYYPDEKVINGEK